MAEKGHETFEDSSKNVPDDSVPTGIPKSSFDDYVPKSS